MSMLRFVSKRLVPLVALVVMGLAVACNGGGEPSRTATPGPSPSATPAALGTNTPTPAATQAPLSPAQPVPLEEGASVTEVGVYLVETATGRLWRLGDHGGAWSTDGETLLSWGCCIGRGGVDVIEVPAGPAVRIFNGDIAAAAMSPDGDRIAFSRYVDGPKGLYVVNRDGSGLKQLSEDGTWSLQWSSRGDRVAFSDLQDHVYLLEVASGRTIDLPDASSYALAWSPDGSTLAFTNDSGLYIYDPETGDRQQVAAGPAGGPILWSPDGTRIAFPFGERVPMAYGAYAGDPEVGQRIPHVVEVEGSTEPKPLPPARNLSWSPDGTKIAYLSEGCITGAWDIYTVGSDGGSAVPLTTMPEGAKEGPYWSPTGATIAFSTFGELILLDAESGEMQTLVVSGTPESRGPTIHLHGSTWSWSPDGRYIQFSAGYDHGICD